MTATYNHVKPANRGGGYYLPGRSATGWHLQQLCVSQPGWQQSSSWMLPLPSLLESADIYISMNLFFGFFNHQLVYGFCCHTFLLFSQPTSRDHSSSIFLGPWAWHDSFLVQCQTHLHKSSLIEKKSVTFHNFFNWLASDQYTLWSSGNCRFNRIEWGSPCTEINSTLCIYT